MEEVKKQVSEVVIPDDVPKERIEEAKTIKEMLEQMERTVTQGSKWFIISNTWM